MVSYNTLAVTAQAVYAVSRTAPARLVVVDNATTDGYAELFTALADAGLCEVIANREQRYTARRCPRRWTTCPRPSPATGGSGPCWPGRRRRGRRPRRDGSP
jgi:hypothetical protein